VKEILGTAELSSRAAPGFGAGQSGPVDWKGKLAERRKSTEQVSPA
jgi:hypothetical protein